MVHASHKNIWELVYLGIIWYLPKCISNIVPYPICMISKYNCIVFQPIFNTDYFPIGIHIQYYFTFFDVESIIWFASTFNVINASSRHPSGFPIRSKFPPFSLLEYIVELFRSKGQKCAIIFLDGGVDISK